MTLADHLLVFIIAVVYPIGGFIGFRRLMRRVAAGEPVNRLQLYRNTLVGHWTLFFLFLALWTVMAREWSIIGFDLDPGPWAGAGAVLTALGIVMLLRQIREVRNATQREIDSIARRFGRISIIIPRNGSELARFYGLAVTAGIVEETLWRGYLIWYLQQFMPLWVAALLTTLGFALAHAYQGLANLPQITAVSAALVALYLLSGSLLFPIVLHAAVDILQGRLGYDVMRRGRTAVTD